MADGLKSDFAPGSALHQKILPKLIARRDAAKSHIDSRSDSWVNTNNKMRMFIDLTQKAKKGDTTSDMDMKEMPYGRSVVVPASYSILHVLQTQLMSIFGGRDPFIQLRGRGPEDVDPSKIMEAVLAYDTEEMQVYRSIYSLCLDSLKFGMGVINDAWHAEYGEKIVHHQPPDGMVGQLLLSLLGPEALISREWGVIKEHNLWTPINPFDYYPDPRVPVSSTHEGEFVGHRFYRGFMYLVERSEKNGGPYFNLDELKKIGRDRSTRRVYDGTDNGIQGFGDGPADELDYGVYELDHLQIKLIPKEWGVGESDRPQVWWFTWANDAVIVRAHQNPYDHQEFTYSVAETDPDFHSAFNPGLIESIDGLQRFMDWSFNTHVQNMMRHLYDAMIIAPSFVEMNDVTNPGPGRHIRVTQLAEELLMSGAYSIEQFIHQLPVQDVTSPHLSLMNQMFQLAQRMSAANDPQMGMPLPDRRTLGEIQTINASASQRIAMIARLIDNMAISKLAKRAISNRLQFTTMEKYYRMVGDSSENGEIEHLLANKYNLQGNFDYIYINTTMPPDPVRQARTWAQILETLSRLVPLIMQSPQYAQMIGLTEIPDINKVARESFKAMGATNIKDFYVKVNVQPDQNVEQQVQAGNMIPLNEVDPNNPPPEMAQAA